MSRIIISLSEQDIRDLELGNTIWAPVNPNLDHSNLQGVVIYKDTTNTFITPSLMKGVDILWIRLKKTT